MSKAENQSRARTAIALLEHAASLLASASNEGPKGGYDIGPDVANLNRNIHALQNRLLPLADPITCVPQKEGG